MTTWLIAVLRGAAVLFFCAMLGACGDDGDSGDGGDDDDDLVDDGGTGGDDDEDDAGARSTPRAPSPARRPPARSGTRPAAPLPER